MVAALSRNDTNANEVPNANGVSPAIATQEPNAFITVYAENDEDANRVITLLNEAAIDGVTVSLAQARPTFGEEAFASVVCHRQGCASAAMMQPRHLHGERLIILSDCTHESTVLHFLEHGARHVFNLQDNDIVLQARLQAALRRKRCFLMRSFTVGDFYFDVQKREVIHHGVPIDLSPKEFHFASYIFSRLGKIVDNAELMRAVWSLPAHMDTRRIDTAACRVRKKLGLCDNSDWELRRIRCVGYRLTRVKSNVIELGS